MKILFAVAATATLALSIADAAAGELTYELTGFPITPHQFSVLRSANVKEQSPSPSLTMAGMPASPHQVTVLTPRSRITEEVAASNPIASPSLSTR